MSIGQRIKLAREKKGMTLEEVAKLCDTTKQTIYKYESEIVKKIPYDKIVLLSNALSVSPSYLFEWDEKEEQPADVGELSDAEINLIKLFRRLPEEVQASYPAALEATLKAQGLL